MKHRVINQHDQIMHGAIPGAIAGFVQSIYGYTLKTLHVSDRIFMDYGAVLILGEPPGKGISIIGLIAHILNAAIFGVIFGYMMKFGKKRYYLVKGIGLAIFIWVSTLGAAKLFKLPLFIVIPHRAAYVMLGGALVWGVTTSLIYKYIDRKQFMTTNDNQKQRNKQQFYFTPMPASKKEEIGERYLKKPTKIERIKHW